MPIVIYKQVSEDTVLAIWKITESKEVLFAFIGSDFYEETIRHENLHWLASRAIIRGLFPDNNFEITKDIYNKPYLNIDNIDYHISITHSFQYAAVIVSKTKNVAIVLTLNSQYAPYYKDLIEGLGNYKARGYQIALKFDYSVRDVKTFKLIEQVAPQFVIQSAKNILNKTHSDELFEQLSQFNAKIASLGAQSILEHIEEKKFDALARNSGFDLVDGDYYNETLTDPFEDSDASQYAVG